MSQYYFAEDGNWGGAEGLLVLDCAALTDDEWELIEDASDSERAAHECEAKP